MLSITVKNIPDHAYEILRQVATTNHRSINSEIICLIEKATVSKAFTRLICSNSVRYAPQGF